jgi:hypothetical protein
MVLCLVHVTQGCSYMVFDGFRLAHALDIFYHPSCLKSLPVLPDSTVDRTANHPNPVASGHIPRARALKTDIICGCASMVMADMCSAGQVTSHVVQPVTSSWVTSRCQASGRQTLCTDHDTATSAKTCFTFTVTVMVTVTVTVTVWFACQLHQRFLARRVGRDSGQILQLEIINMTCSVAQVILGWHNKEPGMLSEPIPEA